MALGSCAFALLAVLYLVATAYLVYRDDLLGGSLARQVGMQHAYEERIAALRAELDRVTSRHVVARQGIGEQVALLLERQHLIGRRQADLDVVVEIARNAGVDVQTALARLPRSRPDGDGAALAYGPAPEGGADIVTGALARGPAATGEPEARLKPLLSAVGGELDTAQREQSQALDALSQAAAVRAAKISAALAPLGIPRDLPEETRPTAPRGGPYIPAGELHFVEKLSMLNRSISEIAALRDRAEALPLRAPVRATTLSSRFGTRDDPFLHRPAFHAGLDFVAPTGMEVRATGAGRVVSAGWSGGYGHLVEIRHADGITTAYGHLSAILVAMGESVPAGALIGLVGSSGRSTGPHLHYETRRDGAPVDPALFLAAGRAL